MMRTNRTRLAAVVVAAGLASTACAFDPSALPVPGAGVPGPTYGIRIEFTDALNLPARAKVMADGARVGTVEKVVLVTPDRAPDRERGYVVVDVEIDRSVRLPAEVVAEMRQSTILGDLHIALRTPPGATAATLPPGGTIPLARTRPPVQIEDTMAALATFVQGGAVTRLQEIVDRLNHVLPRDPRETARISSVIGADAVDLANNLDQVDELLNGFAADAAVMHGRRDILRDLLTESAVDHTSVAVRSIVDVIGVLGALASVAHSLVWLAPIAEAGDAAARAFVPLAFTARPLDLDAPSNLNALVTLVRDKLIPFVEHGPEVDITGITMEPPPAAPVPTDVQVQNILDVLRMIGAVQ